MRADGATMELETVNMNAKKTSDLAISSQAPQECGEGSTTRPRSPDRIVKAHERAAIKTCKVCKTVKPMNEFSYGYRTCKICRNRIETERYWTPEVYERHAKWRAEYYPANRERILKQKTVYEKLQHVAERDKKRRRERYATDPSFKAKTKKRVDRYYELNVHVFRARDAKRRALQYKAFPAWANKEEIKRLYLLALEMTEKTGMKYEVDHIIPLGGRNVCGLHVENNLRVILATENRKKFNHLIEDIV